MKKASPRERLLEAALDLFNKYGYHATGIDRIREAAGVSKKTMYAYFRSKDELILAALRRYDETFRNWLVREVESRAATPEDRLLAVFDVAWNWFGQDKFYGCMFINAAGEFPEEESPIRAICREFKRLTRQYFETLAAEAGAPDPAALSRRLALLLEGSIVTAHVSGDQNAAHDAKEAARILIADALARRSSTRTHR